MGFVKDILQWKDNKIIAIRPENTVYSGLEIMYENNISSLLVMDNEDLKGIFTERDYARKVVLKGKSSKETQVKDIMTSKLLTVSSNTKIEEAMQIMSEKHIRHLPVVDEGNLVGLISIGDVVKQLIEEQKYIIGNLESYIKGA